MSTKNQPHKQLRMNIEQLAKLSGFDHVYFTWDSRHSPAGFPDMILLKEGRMIVCELKAGRDNLSPEQYFWLMEFTKVTPEVYVWWPEDWDEIVEVITKGR